jgi:hypothetical protein
MASPLLIGLLVLLAIEAVHAWKARSRYCGICGHKTGLWHVEDCHKKYRYSPGASIAVILGVMVVVAVAFAIVSR